MAKLLKHILLVVISFVLMFFETFGNTSKADSIRSRELNRKAIILYREGKFSEALDTFNQCLLLRKNIYGKKNYNLAPIYSGIGITYRALGLYDLALFNYILAEQNYLLKKENISIPVANIYANIGNIYRDQLDYIQALQFHERALAIYKNEGNIGKEQIASVSYNIAEILYLLREDKKAREIILQNIDNAYLEDKILYYELLAFINQVEGDLQSAGKCHRQVIELTKQLYSPQHVQVATACLNYAGALISNNNLHDAEHMLNKAYTILQSSHTKKSVALSDYNKFKGFLASKTEVNSSNFETFKKQKIENLNAAILLFKKALTALNFSENENLRENTASANVLSHLHCIDLLKSIADTYAEISLLEKTGRNSPFNNSLSEAIKNYQLVATMIQQARKEISSDESKIQLINLEYSTIYKLIEASYIAYQSTGDPKYVELAFQNAERVKSSSIFDRISNQFALNKGLIPDSLVIREKKLNNTISVYSGKLNEEKFSDFPDSVLIESYQKTIFNATREREDLNRYMENNYKKYFDLKYSGSMFTINEIQNKLKPDQIILEYVYNEADTLNDLYTFLIRSDKVEMVRQSLPENFKNSANTMFSFISDKNYLFTTNTDAQQFCEASHTLYSHLILPFKNDIQDKKLVIVPDGVLSYIPFEGLISANPETAGNIKFNKLNYLIYDYQINYANSANLYFKEGLNKPSKKMRTVAFAPTYNGENVEIGNLNYRLVPLPGVAKEVENISKITRTRVFEGDLATEENFRKNVESFGILHLAMHAFINDSMPGNSSLAFEYRSDSIGENDGILKTAEIYNLDLNASLTVLSACNTGAGIIKKGEGIMSLARGFLYAGCPSMVVSLWEVDDISGTEIMSSFYKNLKKGKSKDEALRAAKLEYLQSANSRQAHPHYWLSFISMGDNSPLFSGFDFYLLGIIALVIAGISADQYFRMKKARRKRAFNE